MTGASVGRRRRWPFLPRWNYWKPDLGSGVSLDALGKRRRGGRTRLTVVAKVQGAGPPSSSHSSVLAGKFGHGDPRSISMREAISFTNPINNTGRHCPFKVKEWGAAAARPISAQRGRLWNPGLALLDSLVISWWREPGVGVGGVRGRATWISATFTRSRCQTSRRATQKVQDSVARTRAISKLGPGWDEHRIKPAPAKFQRSVEVGKAWKHGIDRQFRAPRPSYRARFIPRRRRFPPGPTRFLRQDAKTIRSTSRRRPAMLDAAGYPVKGAPRFKNELCRLAGLKETNVKDRPGYVKAGLRGSRINVDLSVPDRAKSLQRIYTTMIMTWRSSKHFGQYRADSEPRRNIIRPTESSQKRGAFRNRHRAITIPKARLNSSPK